MRRIAIAACLSLPLIAGGSSCGSQQASQSTSRMFVEVDGGNLSEIDPANLGTDAFVVIVEPGVVYSYESHYSSDTGSSSTRTVNDMPFEIDGLNFRIGSKSYGPFERGDEVTITSAGVFVGETNFGELPDA